MRKLCGILAILTMATILTKPNMAGEVPIKFVNSLAFQVKVKPVNEEDQDALAADLYITRFPDSGWLYEGPCRVTLEANDKTFTRTVKVPADGAYFFTSRGVDAVGKAPEPLKGETAQVKVVADTLPPKVELLAPKKDAILRADADVSIEWIATDEHLAKTPIDLYYSFDGANWQSIAEKQPNTGHFLYRVPATAKIYFRITAVDEAGNLGEASSPRAYKVMLAETPTPPKMLAEAITASPISVEPRPLTKDNPSDVQRNGESAAAKYLTKDPRPSTRHPDLDANDGEIPTRGVDAGKTAYIAYLMAGNLVRQGRLKDSLRYFRSAVDIDPNFSEAWNDMALVYRELGAFTKADSCIVRALKISPENARYLNTRGMIYQAAGLDILRDPSSSEESLARANDLILFAVKTYGQAIDAALRGGTLAERAETYFHLGEICYFANQDPTGARQYWLKILELHSPTPELDEVMLDRGTPNEKLTRSIYEKNTELWVNLQTWQKWAREYLRQLNELERGVALPRAPFSGADFQNYAHPAMGANTAPQAAMPESLTLLPDGSYATATPGYTMLPQPAPARQTSPQVQVINNYGDRDAMTNRRPAPQNESYSEVVVREYNAHNYPPASPNYGAANNYNNNYNAANNYRNDPVNRTMDYNNGYNRKEGYYPQSAPPQGKWLNSGYGGRPQYTYETPRARQY